MNKAQILLALRTKSMKAYIVTCLYGQEMQKIRLIKGKLREQILNSGVESFNAEIVDGSLIIGKAVQR